MKINKDDLFQCMHPVSGMRHKNKLFRDVLCGNALNFFLTNNVVSGIIIGHYLSGQNKKKTKKNKNTLSE